jgi:putative ABC transport system permease protein
LRPGCFFSKENKMETFWQDLRYALRMLRKKPGFTLVAVITLALGIGANTAIFSVVNGVLLRPLPIKEPDRLMMIRETKLPQFPEFSVASGNFLDWQKQNTVFERLVAFRGVSFNLIGTGDPERLRGMAVSDGFFPMLGGQPQLGRDFLAEENKPGHSNVVILSQGLWQRRFGGDAKILNQSITLDAQSYTVVGIMPAEFRLDDRETDLWTPVAFTEQHAQNHGGHSFAAIGQLKRGVTPEQARAELSAIAGRLAAQYPQDVGWNIKLIPLQEFSVRSIKPALLVLLVAVAFVLLIACVNVANLLLARAAGRQKEIATRSALGAGRWRIVRQLLTESVLLAIVGGAVGLLLARWGMALLLQLAPQDLPRLSSVSLDGRALAFTAAITLLTGLFFGLVPALQASKPNLNETMKDAGRGSTEGGRRQLIRNTLVVLEVASALVLLVGAGLMIKSFWRLQQVDPGFDPQNALTMSVQLPKGKYPEEVQQVAFFQQLLERTAALPGVQAAGASQVVPLSGSDMVLAFEIDGRPPLPPDATQSTNYYSVSADYFKSMGIPLRRGRGFTERDTKESPKVAVINETMAKKMFPDEEPLGKRITFDNREKNPEWFEIVGIVGDVKQYGLDQATTLQTYEPYTQQTFPSMTLVVRTAGNPANMSAAIRSEILKLDKDQPASNVRTLSEFFSTSIAQQRFAMALLGVFAAVALILAAVGIYGVLSYAVTHRSHEIGIRMALGAGRGDVLRLVVGQGMLLTVIGVAGGLVTAFALTRLMANLLFGVTATDASTFAGVATLLMAVALLACYIPARRATKVDPLVALRYE